MTDTAPLLPSIAASGLHTMGPWPDEPLDDESWHALIHAVRGQSLAGLLAHAVRHGHLPATRKQGSQAGEEHFRGLTRVLAIERGALETLGLLSAAGIEARVLKGSAVAHLDYPDPALRLFTDLDLLVSSAQFDQAVAVLTAAGQERRHRQPRPGFDRRFSKGTSFYSPTGLAVDLHRTFVMGPFGLRVDLADLWGPGCVFSVSGTELEALDSEARFLHACFHAALGDRIPRLVPQRDVAQMLLGGRLDLDRVALLMRRWRAEPVVARALAHTWHTLRLADRPALVAWALDYRPSARSSRELALYSEHAHSYTRKSLGALRVVPGLRGKAAYAFALAFPHRSYVEGRYPSVRRRWGKALREATTSQRPGRGGHGAWP